MFVNCHFLRKKSVILLYNSTDLHKTLTVEISQSNREPEVEEDDETEHRPQTDPVPIFVRKETTRLQDLNSKWFCCTIWNLFNMM